MNAISSQNRRWWWVVGMLALGLGCAMLIPNAGPIRPSRLAQRLPEECGSWFGRPVPVSDRELSVLAEDTVFVRSQYEKLGGDLLFPVEASLVFSGKDMNNSIHRPENCLRAQGWTFVSERYVNIGDVLPGEAGFPVREIVCKKARRNPETQEFVRLPNGNVFEDWQLIFYTFIGANDITPSHYGRTFRDIRDRLTGGYDQQWAYATFATMIPSQYAGQGLSLGATQPLDENQTRELLAGFMRELLPPLVAPGKSASGGAGKSERK